MSERIVIRSRFKRISIKHIKMNRTIKLKNSNLRLFAYIIYQYIKCIKNGYTHTKFEGILFPVIICGTIPSVI